MSDCRVAWEAIRTELSDDDRGTKLKAILADRVGDSRASAYMAILSQTKQLAAAPVHLHGARAPALRAEAQVLLTCTASLLALATELAPEACSPVEQADQVEPSSSSRDR